MLYFTVIRHIMHDMLKLPVYHCVSAILASSSHGLSLLAMAPLELPMSAILYELHVSAVIMYKFRRHSIHCCHQSGHLHCIFFNTMLWNKICYFWWLAHAGIWMTTPWRHLYQMFSTGQQTLLICEKCTHVLWKVQFCTHKKSFGWIMYVMFASVTRNLAHVMKSLPKSI